MEINSWSCLMLSIVGKNTVGKYFSKRNFETFIFASFYKVEIDISCKIEDNLHETTILFSWINMKISPVCRLLNLIRE